MTEVEQPPQNGIDLSAAEDDDNSKARPADIEQDMREMERRKRVEAIMGSKLFREELERIVDTARDGGASGILQQLSDIVGMPASRVGSVFKSSNCMLPINDIRGVESMGYAKGEKILRCKLAATFRLLDLYGWTQGLGAQITARLKVDQEYFLVNPYGLLYHEITASSLNKVDMQGQIIEQGTTNFGVNKSHFVLHSVLHAARPDIRCAIYIGASPVVAISSLKTGLLPLTKDACVLGEISTHPYSGTLLDTEERDRLVRNLGPNSKVLLLSNYGALCCGETIEEAFFAACHIVQACETQLKLLPVGLDNLVLIPEESRKVIYEQSRRPPEDLEKKFAAVATTDAAPEDKDAKDANAAATTVKIGAAPKWRVGGAEFEALMRMLDNAGYRTGYIYRHPLIKSEPPKPKNDVELPPAVSSLGYLLEEEELYRQGIWKKGDLRKGGDRSRWLNSPNVYQKVEVLETGTPDPKKITKWVADGSPTHSTPVRIEDPLQFVPAGTNPKEFKRLQQQIKDNRRADKISAGPQSHILEGVTWDEANRIKDATVSSAGDHVVLMGAASKGIIQRGFQHNATVYKAPYAKNPFDNVTDDELNEYKRTVERKKKSIHGEYTDTDFSESEALSSLQTSGAQQTKQTTTTTTAAVSQSEPEDVSEHQVIRIETQQAPVPSQAEVVLSDVHLHIHTTIIPSHTHQEPINLHKHHLSPSNRQQFFKTYQLLLAQKYAFLFEHQFASNYLHFANPSVYLSFMIHKIEIFPHYTYPLASPAANISIAPTDNGHNIDIPYKKTTNERVGKLLLVAAPSASASASSPLPTSSLSPPPPASLPASSSPPPYRTVSHYGFNYPLTYLPTITIHPVNLLSAVELQRQKVIAFIKSTAISFVQHRGHFSERSSREARGTPDSTEVNVKAPTHAAADDVVDGMLQTIESDSPKALSSLLKRDDNNGSFISVKEIQLEPKPRRNSKLSLTNATYSCGNNTAASTDDNQPHDHDALSEQFSSLLSIGGASYPGGATTNSHSGGDLAHEHDEHFGDYSFDNCSSLTAPRHAASENLYRSYRHHHFLPMTVNNRSRSFDHDIQHKPECEQALDIDLKTVASGHNPRHVALTLHSLKRRAPRSHHHHHHHHHDHDHDIHDHHDHHDHDQDHDQQHESEATYSTNSSGSLKSLQIHINITIKNSDCVKNLQTHEREFKRKLEKVIDDEINLITTQLAEPNHQHHHFGSNTTLPQFHSTGNHEVASADDVAAAAAVGQLEDDHAHVHFHDDNANLTFQPASSSSVASTTTLPYRHILALLEHELDNLLNSIIRANELHNRAVICDCKTKISQISDDIRASLKVVKLDN